MTPPRPGRRARGARRLRLAAAAVLATATVGGAIALAGIGGRADIAPPPASWTTRPEVPATAHDVLPFGFQTTDDGPRPWALGRSGSDDELVVLTRAPKTGGWDTVGAPLAHLDPVGAEAPQHAAEMSADGHGALLVVPHGQANADATLYARKPGADFTAAPAPGPALQSGEHLVGHAAATDARALLAVAGGDDLTAATFVVPTDDDGVATGVLRHDALGWTREQIDAPGLDPLHPLGLAVVALDQAWLLARAGAPDARGDHLVLLHRGGGALPEWTPMTIPDDALLGGKPLPDGVDSVTVAGAPADPLTAADGGLWIDLRLKAGSKTVDATEHLKVTLPAPAASTSTSTSGGVPEPQPSTTSGSVPAVTETTVKPDGSWCDLRGSAGDAVCDHPLGLALATGGHGYRSIAFGATENAPFGTRFISAPTDDDVPAAAPRRAAQRQGGFAALIGDAFSFQPGIGDDGTAPTQAIAFAPDGSGLIGGTDAVGATSTKPPAARPKTPPLMTFPWDTITHAVLSPSGDGHVLVASRWTVLLSDPKLGWTSPRWTPGPAPRDEGERRPYSSPRGLAWPRKDLVIGVGSAGLLSTVHAEPEAMNFDFFIGRPDEHPPTMSWDKDLPVEATLMDVDCTRDDPLECTAVGLDGLVVRGDGDHWTTEQLPGAAAHADATSVRYAGRTALIATSKGLYTAEDGHYKADTTITTPVREVATLADGGAVVDGRWERDAADDPWHKAVAPLEGNVVAVAAYRSDGHVHALVSVTRDDVPLPEPMTDQEPEQGGPQLTDPVPFGAVALRETDDGWVDLDHGSFATSGGRDQPDSTPNTLTFAVDEDGTGWMLGGIASNNDRIDHGPRISASSTVGYLDKGAPADAPAAEAPPDPAAPSTDVPETPVPEGAVRLAIGGHPACLDRCDGAAGQGYTPDEHLRAAVARVNRMADHGAGPGALIVGGGRASKDGEALDTAGARRFHELLAGSSTPAYSVLGAGDVPGGGRDAFAAGFAKAPAPQGSGTLVGAPESNITPASAPAAPEPDTPGKAHLAFAFDVHRDAGAVRVAVIDNAAGSLAGGKDGDQAHWLDALLDRSKTEGIPVVVVGSAPLDGDALATPADDADDELALLGGRASAYVATGGVDDPTSPTFGGVTSHSVVQPQGAAAPLQLFQSGTLGYGPTGASIDYSSINDDDQAAFQALVQRVTSASLLLLDVQVSARDPQTNVAPVAPLAEPLLGELNGDQVQKIPLGAAYPMFVYGADPGNQRYAWKTVNGKPEIAGGTDQIFVPVSQCQLAVASCADAVDTDVEFSSSDPHVGMFVATYAEKNYQPQIKTDGQGNVIPDPHSPTFCPLGLGTTTISVRVAGQLYTHQVEVAPLPTPSSTAADVRATKPNGSVAPKGTCSFNWFVPPPPKHKPDEPTTATPPTTPGTVVPGPVINPLPVVHHHPVHHHVPAPHHPVVAKPAPVNSPFEPLPAGPLPVPETVQAASSHPAAAPTKPPAPPPPATPHGLSAAPAHAPMAATQVQAQVQAAEQRKEQIAVEFDSAAVAYERPASPLPWELLGGALVLLVIGGGVTAGRARRRAVAPAWVRPQSAPDPRSPRSRG